MKATLVLTGANKGATRILNGVQFRQGKAVIEGPEKSVSFICGVFTRSGRATVEGPQQEVISSDGKHDIPQAAKPDPIKAVRSDDGSTWKGTPSAKADVGKRHADAARGGKGDSTLGDGHSNPGVSEAEALALRKAVKALDQSDDSLWAEDGMAKRSSVGTKLTLEAFKEVCGDLIRGSF